MEVLNQFGTPEQKDRWLLPLLDGEIRSAFAMTEPDVASSDATNIAMRIDRDGDDYVLNGRKWWTSNALHPHCRIMIVMGKTQPAGAAAPPAEPDPGADRHARRGDHPRPAGVRLPGPGGSRRGQLQRRPRAGREPDRRRRRRLHDRPGPPGTGPDPPLHARDRRGRAGAGADVPAGDLARDLRAAGRRRAATSRTGSPSRGSRSRWRGC